MPDFAANPIKTRAKAATSMPEGKVGACSISSVQFRVPDPMTEREVSNRKMRPTKEKSMEADAMKIYLIAASIFSRADRMATSMAERIVVSSAQIQKSARLSQKNACTSTRRSIAHEA